MSEKLVKKPQYLDAFFFPNKENESKLINYLKLAEKEMILCIFCLTNDNLADVLLDLHERKV